MRETELLSRGALLLAPECADAWLVRMKYLLTTKPKELTFQMAEAWAKRYPQARNPDLLRSKASKRFKSKRYLHEARRGTKFSQATHGSTYDRGSAHPHVSSRHAFVTETRLCHQEHSADRDFQ